MRIGVRLSGRVARGVLADERRVLERAAGEGARALGRVLRDLADRAPGSVQSVTFDVSDLLLDTARAGGAPVSVLRVLPRAPHHPALAGHPSPGLGPLVRHRATVSGGHDLYGTALAPVDVPAAVRAAREAAGLGLGAMAVVATGAVGAPGHERAVAEVLRDAVPDLQLSLSHEVGGVGLLTRETAAVLNAVLLSGAKRLVDRCRRAAAPYPCWFATGDGGRVSAERLRALPVLGLEARSAMALLGAAVLTGSDDTAVVIEDGARTGDEARDGEGHGTGVCTIGEVRDGLPVVAADLAGSLGVRLAAPQPVLATPSAEDFRANRARWLPGSPDVPAVEFAVDGAADPATAGAAFCQPTAWLDVVVQADTTEELRRQQRTAENRARGIVAVSGATPGTERIVESSVTALAYVRAGTYRLRVRATAGAAT